MKKRLTREERKQRSNRRLMMITYLLFLILLLVWLLGYLTMTAEAEPQEEPAEPTVQTLDGSLPGDDTPATTRCYMTEDEIEANENERIMQALIAKANRIDNCTVTWYTNDTCGKEQGDPGYGITASGFPTVEGLTCAVDNNVIPRYADVFVQFADGTIRQYWATDCGVRGDHIDIFEPDYDTAIQNGCQSLTVWWIKEG